MTVQKWIALIIYALMLATAFVYAGDAIAQTILWIFIALAAVHTLEFLIVRKTLNAIGGSMAMHFLHTLLFGFVHWRPLKLQASKSDPQK